MDQARPLKVIYIGAGISGITGAIEFKKRVPELDLIIYEKNEELGGTWFENRYLVSHSSSPNAKKYPVDMRDEKIPWLCLW
jgi:cation diffusion facilitator CzcD-associated flavoprotein CzcO